MSHEFINLEGSRKNDQPLKICDKCGKPAEPTGGVQITQAKWSCFKCWRLMKSRK